MSREILTIQAKGDKEAAGLLLQKYGVLTEPLKVALKKLELVQVIMVLLLFANLREGLCFLICDGTMLFYTQVTCVSFI